MNNYVTGKLIRELREKNKMTQHELATILNVSDKTISKWETAKGFPDISLIDSLAKALNVSIIELMNGDYITNKNRSCNMLKSNFYVCPVCGNVIYSVGENINSCCGLVLPKLEAELDENNIIHIGSIENDYYVSVEHDMTKEHYISFIAYVVNDRVEIVKMYPEQMAETRFSKRGSGTIYVYCNREGLLKKDLTMNK